MNRRNARCVVASFVAAAASGCGGKSGGELFNPHGTTVADLGGKDAVPIYFHVTNHVAPTPAAKSVGVSLNAGAKVELEVATEDASPLVMELHRIRKDGTTELLAPVDVTSGFFLTTFEASSDGAFFLYFPAPREGARVVVHLECLSGEGRCSPDRQPTESCAPGYACAPGLACALPTGKCDPWVELGHCVVPDGACDAAVAVCGCDQRTYANECTARAEGANVAFAGVCEAARDGQRPLTK